MTKTITILFFLFVVLLMIWLNKPESGKDQELQRLEQVYKNRIDSLQKHYQELLNQDSIVFQHYADAKLKAERARNEADIWKRRYEHEKNNHRHFTNDAIDSLLSKISD